MEGGGEGRVEFAMCRQEGGKEGLRVPQLPDPEGAAMSPTQRPSCSPVAPPVKASHRPLPEGAIEALRPCRTHRSLSPHSSQQWPPLVISRADGCGRDSAFSGTHAPGWALGASSKSPSYFPSPTRQSPRSSERARVVPQPRLRAGGCVRASVCVSGMWERARSWPGIPCGPRPREARAGVGTGAPSKPLAVGASSTPGVQLPTSRRESGELPATLFTELASTGLPEACSSAAVASQEEEEEGRGASPRQLGTYSQSARRCSPRESSVKGLELRRVRKSPVRSRLPGGGLRQTPAVPGRRRRPRPPAPGAHGGGR